jgi:3-methyl-2-oxobutanoate hydroxymethyltransferase
VKLEGGVDQAETIAALVGAGIPVMGHVGLRPQSVHALGGYRVQRDVEQLLADSRAVEAAGAFSVVLECIPRDAAKQVTAALKIPTIGIGAGADCDGQVLVSSDMLGLTSGYVPKFVKRYADLAGEITRAATQFRDGVRDGTFPAQEHGYE